MTDKFIYYLLVVLPGVDPVILVNIITFYYGPIHQHHHYFNLLYFQCVKYLAVFLCCVRVDYGFNVYFYLSYNAYKVLLRFLRMRHICKNVKALSII